MDRLDILVNCAGIMRTARVIDLKLEDWLAVYRVNVEGTFLFCQAAARAMIEQDQGGCIVNISSAAALKADPKHAAYSSSKAAVLALTRVLALELGENRIRVNAILPGATKTPMLDRVFKEVQGIESELLARTLLGRIGTTQDQANAALFLASDLASHITGEYLVVSGGEFLNP
jgi:NAD(P)-dependent dehydrogenase (short-subunit alcohol dehydrogenase family)